MSIMSFKFCYCSKPFFAHTTILLQKNRGASNVVKLGKHGLNFRGSDLNAEYGWNSRNRRCLHFSTLSLKIARRVKSAPFSPMVKNFKHSSIQKWVDFLYRIPYTAAYRFTSHKYFVKVQKFQNLYNFFMLNFVVRVEILSFIESILKNIVKFQTISSEIQITNLWT